MKVSAMRTTRTYQNTHCHNCQQYIYDTDFILPYHELEIDVHTDCDLTAWRHNGKQGPKPGTREYELAIGHRQSSGRNRTRERDTTTAGPVSITNGELVHTERPYTSSKLRSIIDKGHRQPRTWNESYTEVHRMR